MRFIAIAGALLVMAGCASMTTMYSTCDQKSDKFSEVSVCTKTALKADSRYGFHKDYIAYANRAMAAIDLLEEKVAAGQITEKEARYKMYELLAAMRRENLEEVFAIRAATPTNTTIKTNCTTIGTTTNCTSR